MGLLNKAKNLDSEKQGEAYSKDLPRYSLFKSSFVSFLDGVGACCGAFLIKHASVFHLAFPVRIACDIFRYASFDASFFTQDVFGNDIIDFSNEKMRISLLDLESCGCLDSLFSNSILVPVDDLHCVLLFLQFDDSSHFFSNKNEREKFFRLLSEFKREYRENETLIETCTPPFPRYVGFSSVESKLEGAALAGAKANFISFCFEKTFDFSKIHEELDNLAMFYSMVNRINILIGTSNITVLKKDLSLNACVFSGQILDEVIYTMTLKSVMSSIYGSSIIDCLKVVFKDVVSQPKEEIRLWIDNSYNPLLA